MNNIKENLIEKMSLKEVFELKTKKAKSDFLSKYLKINDIGELNAIENVYFKHMFAKFYTPDEEHTKFETARISSVAIIKDTYGKKCFSICVDETWYPTSIKRLSGSNRTEKLNLLRALRKGIEEQIIKFRTENPLNPNSICPVTQNVLGIDAEVDHLIPFNVLAEEWLKTNTNVSYKYDLDKFDYILDEPFLEHWASFHLQKAILRWTSKAGNKISHKLYNTQHMLNSNQKSL